MKRLISITAAVLFFVSGCVSKTAPPTAQNMPSSALIPPWPNAEVFAAPDLSINVSVGQEFIVEYDSDYLAPRFDASSIPPGIAVQLDSRREGITLNHTIMWYLFKAKAPGTANITIKQVNRFGDVELGRKNFTVNVAPPVPNISGNTTLNPWPNAQVFAVTAVPINVSVGQEFVIKFNQFTSSNVDFQPANVVVVESKQFVQNPGVTIPDGTTWILFKAVAAGRTNVSVTETTRFGDPLRTKTFTVIVGPADTSSWIDITYLQPIPESVLSITTFSFHNALFVRFSGSSILSDGATFFSQLYEDGKPCLWWPVDQPIIVKNYFWTISTPLGVNGSPDSMESGHDYLIVLYNDSTKAERHFLVGNGPPANVTK
ncbi:MAG: hypothetical protein Q7J73_00400 [Dehalococcoidales bacterium]|nr:hypothetical protein [Dehalococcoidales bacterium]